MVVCCLLLVVGGLLVAWLFGSGLLVVICWLFEIITIVWVNFIATFSPLGKTSIGGGLVREVSSQNARYNSGLGIIGSFAQNFWVRLVVY